MGLSLSRSIIEAHGGHVWVENNPDKGATFYFDLPGAEATVEREHGVGETRRSVTERLGDTEMRRRGENEPSTLSYDD